MSSCLAERRDDRDDRRGPRERAAGARVTGITCAEGTTLAAHCDRIVQAATHPAEGIVMTASASLMLLVGLQLIGVPVTEDVIPAAEAALCR